MGYSDWKTTVQGQHLDVDKSGDFDCVDVPKSWAQYLFPGVSWVNSIGYGNAKDLFAGASDTYFTKILNDANNPNQLPQQGDILVCGPTPTAGYTNTFDNPYGHTGVVDSASSAGYTIMSQASNTGEACEPRYNNWKFRPVIGWLRPKVNITQGETMPPDYKVNKGDVVNVCRSYGWDPDQTYLSVWVGQPWKAFWYDVSAQPKTLQAKAAAQAKLDQIKVIANS